MKNFNKYWKWANLIGLLPVVLFTPILLQYVELGLEWVSRTAVGQFTFMVVGASWVIRYIILDYFSNRLHIPSKTDKTKPQRYLDPA